MLVLEPVLAKGWELALELVPELEPVLEPVSAEQSEPALEPALALVLVPLELAQAMLHNTFGSKLSHRRQSSRSLTQPTSKYK